MDCSDMLLPGSVIRAEDWREDHLTHPAQGLDARLLLVLLRLLLLLGLLVGALEARPELLEHLERHLRLVLLLAEWRILLGLLLLAHQLHQHAEGDAVARRFLVAEQPDERAQHLVQDGARSAQVGRYNTYEAVLTAFGNAVVRVAQEWEEGAHEVALRRHRADGRPAARERREQRHAATRGGEKILNPVGGAVAPIAKLVARPRRQLDNRQDAIGGRLGREHVGDVDKRPLRLRLRQRRRRRRRLLASNLDEDLGVGGEGHAVQRLDGEADERHRQRGGSGDRPRLGKQLEQLGHRPRVQQLLGPALVLGDTGQLAHSLDLLVGGDGRLAQRLDGQRGRREVARACARLDRPLQLPGERLRLLVGRLKPHQLAHVRKGLREVILCLVRLRTAEVGLAIARVDLERGGAVGLARVVLRQLEVGQCAVRQDDRRLGVLPVRVGGERARVGIPSLDDAAVLEVRGALELEGDDLVRGRLLGHRHEILFRGKAKIHARKALAYVAAASAQKKSHITPTRTPRRAPRVVHWSARLQAEKKRRLSRPPPIHGRKQFKPTPCTSGHGAAGAHPSPRRSGLLIFPGHRPARRPPRRHVRDRD